MNISRITQTVFILVSVLLVPSSALAAAVYLTSSSESLSVGDTVLVTVKVDAQDAAINTVEGEIALEYSPETVLVKDILVTGSPFSLWPQKPVLSEDLKTISFVGGVPSGFQSLGGTLFTLVLEGKGAGQITLNPITTAYLHDGKGSKGSVEHRPLTLQVTPQGGIGATNNLEALLSEDTTAPQPFTITLGQDDSVFDGSKFLSFATTDAESGVRYYEVREGTLPAVRSNGTYVLQEQEVENEVVVTAYDAAGNAREETYNPGTSRVTMAAILILVFAAVPFIVIRRKKNGTIQK